MPNSDAIAISVEHVSKSFKLPHEKQNSIKGLLINRFRGHKSRYEKQIVLHDISFQVHEGEFFGIVGRNCSGKSTLLKILAGIYAPNQGNVRVEGKLTPFIELGVGFNPELSGRENVYLNGALLGFSRRDMEQMYEDIVAFAELERFMDQKLKNYSSGMQVRLAFSIAIRARSSILLLDEVLAVGDEAFQRKCFDYFENLKRSKQTVVIVTHDMGAVERFCTRAMFIEQGEIKLIGKPREVATAYSRSNDDSYVVEDTAAEDEPPPQNTYGLEVSMHNAAGRKTNKFICNEQVTVSMTWDNPDIKHVSITIVSESGMTIFGAGTYQDKFERQISNQQIFKVNVNLREGKYFLQIGLGREGVPNPLVFIEHGPSFAVMRDKDDLRWDGLTKLSHKWE